MRCLSLYPPKFQSSNESAAADKWRLLISILLINRTYIAHSRVPYYIKHFFDTMASTEV